jgi:hypothetical protein
MGKRGAEQPDQVPVRDRHGRSLSRRRSRRCDDADWYGGGYTVPVHVKVRLRRSWDA